MTKTKNELYEEGALNRKILIGPLFNAKDLSTDRQLESRNFWVTVEHPELNDTITYPGPFAKISDNPMQYRLRTPLIGEHNTEIYGDELGLSPAELALMKDAGAI
jgi:crotonobetainyl-CoA:carnitine CoA-transferase CaiB-like acyl-CoA transferase